MSAKTKIEWTDFTWNPVRGCSRVSPGCEHCYAEQIAARFSGEGLAFHGYAEMKDGEGRWTRKVSLVESSDLDAPLRLRSPRRIFVNSMSDLFHEGLSDEHIDVVMAVAAVATLHPRAPGHVLQILTKRAERMRAYQSAPVDQIRARIARAAAEHFYPDDDFWHLLATRMPWPLPNVELCVSVEDQEYARRRVAELVRTPAWVRGVSYEPALGPVAFDEVVSEAYGQKHRLFECAACAGTGVAMGITAVSPKTCEACAGRGVGLDWIIVGGESGSGARPFDLAWADAVVDVGRAYDIPVFVKQLGREWSRDKGTLAKDPKGGDMSAWPLRLRVREFARHPAVRPSL